MASRSGGPVAVLALAQAAGGLGVAALCVGPGGVIEDEVARLALAAAQSSGVDGAELEYDPSGQHRCDRVVGPFKVRHQAALGVKVQPRARLTARREPVDAGVLRDEGEAYAERLRQASVPVQARCEPGLVHNFMLMDDVSPACASAADRIAADLGALLRSNRRRSRCFAALRLPQLGRVALPCPTMSTQRQGGCSCGAVRYRLASEPMFVHCCHCLNCQRQTGSTFAINLLIEADRVEMSGASAQTVEVPRDDGSTQRIYRCPECQVAVFSEYESPELWFVRGGTLDDPTDVTPDVHIYTRSKVRWVTLPADTPAFEAYYDSTKLWPASSLHRLHAITPGEP
jgi:hypothetical protein